MNNKMLYLSAAALAGVLSCSTAAAYRGEGFRDTAKVLDVEPIYETVEVSYPERRCWDEPVYYPASRAGEYAAPVLGGVVGGVVGHQFGRGRGKTAMTIVGTLVGAGVGREIAGYPPRRGYRAVERRCEVVDRYVEEQELVGYRVKYRYKGRTFVTRTTDHPGDRIEVGVNVEPL